MSGAFKVTTSQNSVSCIDDESRRNLVCQAMSWRYAVKKFDDKQKISDLDWAVLESALLMAPSAYGLQPWKFLIIQDPVLKAKLVSASWGQKQVEESSHFVVLASREEIDVQYINELVERMAQVRNVPKETLNPYYNMIASDLLSGPKSHYVSEWAARQSYIALGTLISAAAMLEIDACPMEGIEPDEYDRILNLTESGYRTRVVCALGYRSAEDKYSKMPKVRFPSQRIVHYI